jgi:deoxyribose-phosphate aldolase
MTRDELARILDHSVLKPEANAADIDAGIDVVTDFRIGFYCVQPCWVARAARALDNSDTRVVSVVGFPHGCDRAEIKAQAAALAVADGAAEIDMVINIGALRSDDSSTVLADIDAVVSAARVPVKVILETSALDDAQKRRACELAVAAGAAFVKTSTGFHANGGATVHDVRLLRKSVGPSIGVKASGGIRSLDDVRAMIDAGANRIGTSASAAILQGYDAQG